MKVTLELADTDSGDVDVHMVFAPPLTDETRGTTEAATLGENILKFINATNGLEKLETTAAVPSVQD